MIKDKRGFSLGRHLMIVLIIGLAIGAIMLFALVAGLAGPILDDVGNEFADIMGSTVQETNDSALINATDVSLGIVVGGINQLEWITFAIIFFLILTVLVLAFFVRTYPFLAFLWILLILMLVFMAIFISNAYQDLLNDSYLSTAYKAWESTHFMLSYLPHIITAIGIVGGIVLFVLATRDQEAEAGPL